MPELSVCLETVFTDLPVADRIARIAAAGFRHVEFWHPEATGLRNTPPAKHRAIRQLRHGREPSDATPGRVERRGTGRLPRGR